MSIEITEPIERETAEDRADREAYERERRLEAASNAPLTVLRNARARAAESLEYGRRQIVQCENDLMDAKADVELRELEIDALDREIERLEAAA